MECLDLRHGDCLCPLTGLATIESKSVDLVLCDLPYMKTKCKWDTPLNLELLWKEYKRILKPQGTIVLFGQQPFSSLLVSSNYEWFKYNYVWNKTKPTQYLLANYRPMKQTEDILVFSPAGASASATSKMKYNPQGLVHHEKAKVNSAKRLGLMLNQEHHLGKNNKLLSNDAYKQKFTNYPSDILVFQGDRNCVHPTQKPVALCEWLIKTYSDEGDVVVDNCMGSGTTGLACQNLGRKFVGWEMNEAYFKVASERLKKMKCVARFFFG